MGAFINLTLTLGVSIAIVAYIMYGAVHVPVGVGETDQVWSIFAKSSVARLAAVAGEHIGLWHRVNFTRHMQKQYTYQEFHQGEDITITNEIFDSIPVRVYDAHNRVKNGPAFIWIHGGGWTLKSPEYDDHICANFAKKLGILVVSIRYRLAPEYVFPIPIEDCYKAVVYLLNKADLYAINAKRVAIGGASAGANLAAAVSLKLRDEGQPLPSHQILIVPCLQALDFSLPSYQLYEDNGYLSKSFMIDFWMWYLLGAWGHIHTETVFWNGHVEIGEVKKQMAFVDHNLIPRKFIPSSYLPNTNSVKLNASLWNELKSNILNPYAAPLMANDLSNLPSTYVATAEYDVLRDDGILYSRRLKDAGNMVVHRHHSDAFHSLLNLPSVGWSVSANEDIIEYLKNHL